MCLLCLFVIWCRKNGSDVTAKQILTPALGIKRHHQYKRGKTLIYTAWGGLGGRIQWQPLLNFLLWRGLGACLIAWKEAQRAETRLVRYYYFFCCDVLNSCGVLTPKIWESPTYATPTWGLSSRCGAHQQFMTQGNLIFYKGNKHPQMFNSFLFIVPYVFFLQPSARQEVGPRWGNRGVFRVSTEELWGTLMRQDGDTFFCFSALTPERSFINDACRACNECNHSSSLASMHIWLIFQCCVVLGKCRNPRLSAPCSEFLLCERLCWKPIVSFSVVVPQRNHFADEVPHKCLRLNVERWWWAWQRKSGDAGKRQKRPWSVFQLPLQQKLSLLILQVTHEAWAHVDFFFFFAIQRLAAVIIIFSSLPALFPRRTWCILT